MNQINIRVSSGLTFRDVPPSGGLVLSMRSTASHAADSKRSYIYVDDQLKKIRKLTAFMKKSGLIHLKQGDIELSLVPSAIELDKPEPVQTPEDKPTDQYSQDDALFWSAPGQVGMEGLQ